MKEEALYDTAFDEAAKEKKVPAEEPKDMTSAQNVDGIKGEDKKEPEPQKEQKKSEDFKALYEAEKTKREAAEKALQQQGKPADDGQTAVKSEAPAQSDDIRSIIRSELQAVFGPMLMAQSMRQHVESIAKEHPDWSDIANSDDLKAWIDSHPDYMAQSLRQVAEKGTAQQVVDMLQRYKEYTNGGRNGDARDAQTGDDLTRRMLDATAVRGRSAGPPSTSAASQDFASAFAEAAKALS